MRKYVDQLKPKANKLLSYVTNWQLSTSEKNIDLSRSLVHLMDDGTFPSPIRSFFKLPQFKKLLETMEEEGKFFVFSKHKKKECDSEKCEVTESYPPIEIQNIQIMVEALHKLVHLDYNKLSIKEPCVQAKVLGDNILEYLSVVNMFAAFEGKVVDEILEYLFKSLRKYSEKLQCLIQKNIDDFSVNLVDMTRKPIFNILLHIDRESYHRDVIEEWHPILIELNIDAKLSHLTKQLHDISCANAHKLLNQMKCLLDEKRHFYQRNLPRYTPFILKKHVLENLPPLFEKGPIMGQRINELFYDEFLHQRYEVIEARQLGVFNKCRSYAEQLWPIKKSLTSLINQYHNSLPSKFSKYFESEFSILARGLFIFGKPNHLAVQLTSGFFAIQLDYLSDMLTEDSSTKFDCSIKDDVINILPIILSFTEMYYAHKPNASFKTIRSSLENIYLGDEALKSYSQKDVENHINSVFSHLLPVKEGSFSSLEAMLGKIITISTELSNKLPAGSMEKQILSSVVEDLCTIDLPSYSQSWYSLGSLLSALYIILSKEDEAIVETLEIWKSRVKDSKFFQTMFYQS